MVLESLINPTSAERHPREMFFVGIIYSSIALFLSLWIFEQYASLVMVFLTVLACVPLMYNTIRLEENKDLSSAEEFTLLKEHSRALSFFMFLFFGVTIGYTFWYVVLPTDIVGNLFSVQAKTILHINNQVTGEGVQYMDTLFRIFFNNLKVLIFCILFAFIYGVGAIFILVWNASVIGTAMGNAFRTYLGSSLNSIGIPTVGAYFQAVSLSIARYIFHGVPEILAYFIGGLAGGIISIAIVKHHLQSDKFEKIILDAADLIILAIVMLIFAALIEVFVTPILF